MGGGRNTPTSSAYPQLAPKPVGKLIQSIYTDRLRQFLDQGQYGQQSLLAKQYHNETNEDKYIKVRSAGAGDLELTAGRNQYTHHQICRDLPLTKQHQTNSSPADLVTSLVHHGVRIGSRFN